MQEHDWLVLRFEEKRTRLRAVAYRMLGSLHEADDAVQEAWMRLQRPREGVIDNLDGWLTTVIGRVCLDILRLRKSRREEPIEEHVPDLIVSSETGRDPEQTALIAESVGIALLVVLETLAPAERLAYVLHDMFAVQFEEVASIVGCSPVAARQLASRARRRVQRGAPLPDVDRTQQRRVVDAFFAAVRQGDFEALLAVLDPDIVIRTDHGTLRKIQGARAAAEGAMVFAHLASSVQPALINGVAGIVSQLPSGEVFAVMRFIVRGDRIAEIDVIRDPERLRRVDLSKLQ
jgi:RNA polymerase sigma factor (sigma-70 family)